ALLHEPAADWRRLCHVRLRPLAGRATLPAGRHRHPAHPIACPHPGRTQSRRYPNGEPMSDESELSPKEQARLRARERKNRPPKMVVDNAGVKRIQLALKTRKQPRPKPPGS